MKNKGTQPRAFKDAAYTAFADVTKALANPKRLELLDLLIQRPFRVDELADGVGQSVGNTSQHLQVLRRARVVETTRRGTAVEYRLAPGVAEVFVALRRLAEARSAELTLARRDFFAGAGAAETIDADALRAGLAAGEVVLVDLRPADEFVHGHVPGARSIPLAELAERLDGLPPDKLIVATCRGPTCVFAAQAVRALRNSGRRAVRFEQGVAEWRADGGAIAVGAA